MLLKAEDNCWRVERAGRFAVLMENAAYFETLAQVLPRAQRSILLLGWQFDPRTRLDPEGPAHERGTEIGHLLRRIVRDNPELKVRLLIWRMPLPIAWGQDFFPQRAFDWFRRRPINFRLDRARPFGACHHQKVVVIDDSLALCGGGDVSVDRWDEAAHRDGDPRRCTPTGILFPPRHETMCLLDGPAARALGDLARERWFEGTGETLEPQSGTFDHWPKDIAPDALDVPVGIARTEPAWRGAAGIREIEQLHLEAIAGANKLIYLENQYFTSPLIAAALAERLEDPNGPEVVVVSTARAPSWFDHFAMDSARRAILDRLRKADRFDRFSAWTPLTRQKHEIIVHAKVSIIDDRILRIGSANLNNRSCGFDTECDVAIEAEGESDAVSDFIRRHRSRTVGHFLGVDGETFDWAHAASGSLKAAIEELNYDGRLAPLSPGKASWGSRFMAEWQVGDPATPADSWRPWRRRRLSRVLKQTVAQAAEAAAADDSSKSITSGK
ncbi:MAG TPA: phospholipase D-like domain-containing protein [Caulobacteraceae bacterium]|nr:phospholipase D-like domain-containing protein [Caulobacteraceae bacterium]